MPQTVENNEMNEGDIENVKYCTLVGTTAQVQAGIEFMTEMRSLGAIKHFIEEEMKKENIAGQVTVRACDPTENSDGTFTYIVIGVNGVGSTEIYSRDRAIANEINYQIKINDDLYHPGMKFE